MISRFPFLKGTKPNIFKILCWEQSSRLCRFPIHTLSSHPSFLLYTSLDPPVPLPQPFFRRHSLPSTSTNSSDFTSSTPLALSSHPLPGCLPLFPLADLTCLPPPPTPYLSISPTLTALTCLSAAVCCSHVCCSNSPQHQCAPASRGRCGWRVGVPRTLVPVPVCWQAALTAVWSGGQQSLCLSPPPGSMFVCLSTNFVLFPPPFDTSPSSYRCLSINK